MKKLVFFLIAVIASVVSAGQVGVGSTSPHPSARLELESTDRGFLPPRLTTMQREAIADPAEGLTIFNTDLNCLEFWDGVLWVNLCCPVPGQPSIISGEGEPYIGYAETYSVVYVEGVTYTWVVPDDWIIDSGQGTHSINVTVGEDPGVITVTPSNECGIGRSRTLAVSPVEPPIEIPGNELCEGAIISASGCASLPGATLNDDGSTPNGYEYDWSGAAGYVVGGTTRALVEINGQCWYRRNADNIPYNFNPVPTWQNHTDVGWSGYYSFTNYGEGRLYQWSAAMNGSTEERAQGVCAPGFHIPSDCEWMYLENSLGMSLADQESEALGRTSGQVGRKLSNQVNSWNNSSGFTGRLPGYKTEHNSAGFLYRGDLGYYRSSTAYNANYSYWRRLDRFGSGVGRSRSLSNAFGYSVRCLRD